jgi:hypothetical protein
MPSSLATTFVLMPAATNARTSRSRGLSAASSIPVSAAIAAAHSVDRTRSPAAQRSRVSSSSVSGAVLRTIPEIAVFEAIRMRLGLSADV